MNSKISKIKHAVIPAAGRGTRFLPATKVMPKEMLPIVDKPGIQYVIEEASSCGIKDLLLITRYGKNSIEDHFDSISDLEDALQAKGDFATLEKITNTAAGIKVASVRQGRPLGLGHAVLQAAGHIGDNPFAVMLPDDLMHPEDPVLELMTRVHERLGGSVVALLEVTPQEATAYGNADVEIIDFSEDSLKDRVFEISDLVEKPSISEVRSKYAVVGRYILDPSVFKILETLPPGCGGEIQLTDALSVMASRPKEEGGGLYGVVIRGRRFDTGTPYGYLQTIVSLAVENENFGESFNAWLKDFVR
ncbi:UTP--glucose-1-phosphate uridylyltransferase [Actinomyces sp. zg-332]|uniref:UTP--glucose-1-phosphate uridylyltransferase n=1 Tax=Actinomyces sp. zg-332 TaxID=2708340 RepID=UPI00141F9F11|nr:UTP--glucose-1-phosphate uridylyltransferase [Actinomyces sp. zg-332]QPK94354.1 UTP--glucose-1-phosphate uridylyltransferase [Actinomyces sp. zg-332]